MGIEIGMGRDRRVAEALALAEARSQAFEVRVQPGLDYQRRQRTLFGARPYMRGDTAQATEANARTEARIVAQRWSDALGAVQARASRLAAHGMSGCGEYLECQDLAARCLREWQRWHAASQ